MKSIPWWYHFAVLGKSAGVAIGAFAGIAQLVPVPYVSIGGAVLAGIASLVTGYAAKGVSVVQATEPVENK